MLGQNKQIRASEFFLQEKGILEIEQYIEKEKDHESLSSLYNFKGVLNYEIGNLSESRFCFDQAILFNHLNYAAYFNLCSVYIKEGCYLDGLKNLCASLSCLYLIRGRIKNSEVDISKCIKFSENNHEGRLIRALQFHHNGKFSLALNQINWVLDAEPSNKEVIQIKKIIEESLAFQQHNFAHYSQVESQKESQNNSQAETMRRQNNKKLVCTLYDGDSESDQGINFVEQIKKKMIEFRGLLENVVKNGLIVGKTYGSILLRNEDKNMKVLANEGDSHYEKSLKIHSFNDENRLKQENLLECSEKLIKSNSQTQKYDGKLMIDESKKLAESLTIGLDFCFQGEVNNSQSALSHNENTSSITIYGSDDDHRAHIRIERIQLAFLSENERERYKSLYCLFNYQSSETLLLKSQNSNGSSQQQQEESSQNRQLLTVKLYNKEILSFNDLFLGEGQKLISGSGSYEVAIKMNGNQQKYVGMVELSVRVQDLK